MGRSGEPFPILLAAVVGALLAAAHAPAATPVSRMPLGPTLARLDSLSRAGNASAAIEAATESATAARARGDLGGAARLLVARAAIQWFAARPGPAEVSAREALKLARAATDPAMEMRALRWLAVAVEQRGGRAEADAAYRRSLDLALRLGDREHEGWARVGVAYSALAKGRPDEARAQYEQAIAAFTAAGNPLGERWALNGLGMVHQSAGRPDEARACYRRVLEAATAANDRAGAADALSNLGAIEFQSGAPEAAVTLFREAEHEYAAAGNVAGRANAARSLAVGLTHLGHLEDAAALLDTALAACRERGLDRDAAPLLEQLATIRRIQRRLPEAADLYERAIAILRPLGDARAFDPMVGRARVSAQADSAASALAWLDRELAAAGPLRRAMLPPSVGWCRGELLERVGRLDEARAALLSADDRAAALGVVRGRMGPLVRAAEIERRRGRPGQVAALLRRAADLWERERSLSRDPAWREETAESARGLYQAIADQLLAGPDSLPLRVRASRAFDALQIYKARTLRERMRGSAGGGRIESDTPVTVRELQNRVLGEREVLLDLFLGPRTTFLFAVTRDSCRMVRLDFGDSILAPRLQLYRDLLATRPRGAADIGVRALEDTRRALSGLLFGPVFDLTSGARRIVVAPDGWLNVVPAAAFELQPERAARSGAGDPGAVVTQVPSASILNDLRSRNASRAARKPRVLAVLGAPGAGQRPLGGAAREAAWLGRRYGAEVRRAAWGRSAAEATALDRCDVLHIAAHTRLDDQYPWRSGILLGDPPRADGDSLLRAADVAGLRLEARLVVLSACESGRGRLISGEGAIGITGAFLVAGSSAVIASLWPVSDQVTTGLMQAFYRSLEGDRPVAEALREAQRFVARSPRTAHPFYWAGFVVVGDGEARVALRPRGRSPWNRWTGSATLAVMLLLVAVGLGSRATRKPAR